MTVTAYRVRTDLSGPLPMPDSTRLLDWAPGATSSTVQFGHKSANAFFEGWRAPREALDLFLLGAAAYCVDKTATRGRANDAWTRRLDIDMPVADVSAWRTAGWASVLSFLTGDKWSLTPYGEARSPLEGLARVPVEVTPVADVDAI